MDSQGITQDTLYFATLEALAYAVEVSHEHDVAYLNNVRHYVELLSRELALPSTEAEALRLAALLHHTGCLGVPEHILHKSDSLTKEEEAALACHTELSVRFLSSLPLPAPVSDILRHPTERWDGSGTPGGLAGYAIPHGARILAVAAAYSARTTQRRQHVLFTQEEAFAEITALAGLQFDPEVVHALQTVLQQNHHDGAMTSHLNAETHAALDRFAAARRETSSLAALTEALTESLHLEAINNTLLTYTREIVPCAACVLFLPEDDGEFLRAQAAHGVNSRHLLGSLARVGAYLTGRTFTRCEAQITSFLADDLILRDVSDVWTPFRSTLIVPLEIGAHAIGTLNLYAEEPNAFSGDALRVAQRIALQSSRVLDNARRFAAVQETAYTDALTGLRNARYLREFLDREINRANREELPMAVLNIDLDNFKPINDLFGHARGDQTLREVAEILSAYIRSYDLAVRYAGDEFVVVLSRAGRVPAEVVAAKLKRAVEQHGQMIAQQEEGFPQLGISIGIALYPDDGSDLQSLLCRSDAAMYTDKQSRRSGRNSGGDGRQAA